jgi:hypothetical protein
MTTKEAYTQARGKLATLDNPEDEWQAMFLAGCDFMFSELVGQDADHVQTRILKLLTEMRNLMEDHHQ